MDVVAVPSLPKQSHLYTEATEVINSLLDLRPENWGLPPFEDWIDGTLPLEPWHIGGPVIKGYGRGSKVLGIPTANLSVEGYASVLAEHPAGVYFGWAKLSTRGFYKMAMSIGWNPFFNNTEKTIEPWLLHKFDEDFYGEELHLVVVGYIRPEANFPSLETLVAKIHEDGKIAENALELPLYAKIAMLMRFGVLDWLRLPIFTMKYGLKLWMGRAMYHSQIFIMDTGYVIDGLSLPPPFIRLPAIIRSTDLVDTGPADEYEIGDEYSYMDISLREQQQQLLDEEALRETLEEEAKAEKELDERIKQEQAHDELFRLEFEVKSDSEYESD
nr:bifunctional riboflavin kinase/FMN phosphatase [Tanacetum cinerariifolium]